MNTFTECSGLSPQVLASLERMKFLTPTPIQAQAIPLVLSGRDVLGSAQTGTGKTGAFAIPMVSKLLNNEIQAALVLTPTRELAAQVLVAIEQMLGKNSGIYTALLIGGEDIRRQMMQLRKNPRIIVGTPGRINDHIERGSVQLSKVGYVVLDETDRMLDMGFGQQIDSIIAQVNPVRQTLMFSATMPNNIMNMASKYLKNPERIAIGSCLKPIAAIQQETVKLVEDQKYDHLVKELTAREGSVVVFVKTKFGAKKIADRLYRDRFEAQAIHGNLRQNKRDQVIKGFKNRRFRILVATDVAARGLDVPHVEHVINHDLPQCPEDYIHRIGRTARAGATGAAINFITPQDNRLWRAIERFMNTGESNEGHQNSGGGRSFGGRSDRSGGRGFGSGPRRFGSGGGSRSGGGRFDRNGSGSRGDRFERPARDSQSEFSSSSDGETSARAPREQGEFSSDRPFRRDRSSRPAGRFDRGDRGGDRFERPARAPRSEFSSDSSASEQGEFSSERPFRRDRSQSFGQGSNDRRGGGNRRRGSSAGGNGRSFFRKNRSSSSGISKFSSES